MAGQCGVVTRAQCLERGLTERAVDWRVSTGRWIRLHPGVYLTQPGRNDWQVTAMAALLACGRPSALGGASAGHAWGLVRAPGPDIEVVVPLDRRVRRNLSGVTV